jgi:hypothetical protein
MQKKLEEPAPRMVEPSQTTEDPTIKQKNLLQEQNNLERGPPNSLGKFLLVFWSI